MTHHVDMRSEEYAIFDPSGEKAGDSNIGEPLSGSEWRSLPSRWLTSIPDDVENAIVRESGAHEGA
jgi:hypothetical protein